MDAVLVRYIDFADLADIVRCERARGIKCWDKESLKTLINKPRVRGLVAETILDNNAIWVCGAMIFAVESDGYEILLLSHHPEAPEETKIALLRKLYTRSEMNDKKNLRVTILDGDYSTVRFFQDQGWEVKLRPNPVSTDIWVGTFKQKAFLAY
jgi:hypothetical protein